MILSWNVPETVKFTNHYHTWPTSSHDNQTDCQTQESKIAQEQPSPEIDAEARRTCHGTDAKDASGGQLHPSRLASWKYPCSGVSEQGSQTVLQIKPSCNFLDVGMTAEFSGSGRVNLLEFFKAVARRDGRTAAECTLRLSKERK
ncbi:hypothetical protein KIW84_014380 [Lathyrus oleraceus]|nr:hypothetical protein KIW84_014380 [Pisum sativum]